MPYSLDQRMLDLLQAENQRQQDTITLIASENYASPSVCQAAASSLTNKYAEGYPSKRYYSGCTIVDEVEKLAIERLKKLFNAEHANVQPHCGSSANMAVYQAVLNPGDTILGMNLAEGGHLTHGHPVNFSGTLYKAISYNVDPITHLLDYEHIEKLAQQHRPKLIIAGASAYSRTIDFARFAQIAQSVNALFLADIAHIAGLIAVGLHPTPVGHADFITSTTHKTLRGPRGGLILCTAQFADKIDRAVMPGIQGGPLMNIIAAKAIAFGQALDGSFFAYQHQVIANSKALADNLKNYNFKIITDGTDNHLFIVDLQNKNITGHQAQTALEIAGITTSKSCIPQDPQKPWITSGIRFGTPAVTTRGMKEKEMEQIAIWINDAITNHQSLDHLYAIAQEVSVYLENFPIWLNSTTGRISNKQQLHTDLHCNR